MSWNSKLILYIVRAAQDAIACRGIAEICRKSSQHKNDGDLIAKRVSAIWLQEFLKPDDLAAVACLSVFLGSFDAAGAAAVCYPSGKPQHTMLFMDNYRTDSSSIHVPVSVVVPADWNLVQRGRNMMFKWEMRHYAACLPRCLPG